MPPTSFFERAASEDAEEETGFADDMESILDEALAARIKWHRLTGHYRSRHESLIAFSNHRYYGRSEEHTSELQSLMRIPYAVFCLKKKKPQHKHQSTRP